MIRISTTTVLCVGAVAVMLCLSCESAPAGAETQLPLAFTGGHDIGPSDFGRPCNLMAAALGVKTEEFRQAFSSVHPAHGGGPTREEAQKNKAALLKVLAPLGVTNERMDEVANYYRYQPQKGQLWRVAGAKGYAVVENGKVMQVVITDPGSGYSSLPKVAIEGMNDVSLKPTLHLDKDMRKNGSIEKIEVIELSKS